MTWVHPSWRDLVIDDLASDAGARRRFLERCSVEGALLALSRAGGRRGERRRPLLVADLDWDALTERLYQLVPELTDPDLLRLLTTLEDGLTRRDRDFAELGAVGVTVLRRAAGCWEDGGSYASEALLDAWHDLWRLTPESVPLPNIDRVWHLPPRTRTAFSFEFLDRASPAWARAAERDGQAIVARILADLSR